MAPLDGTSLYFTPHRLYDPALGVFTSRDPLLYVDSPSSYAYAAHNPVDFANPSGLSKAPIAEAPSYVVKQTVIHFEEAQFYKAQDTPPPEPEHRYGFYPLKDAEKWLSNRNGSYWDTLKSALAHSPLHGVSDVLGLIEDIAPYNVPDQFLAAGSYARRWVWYAQRGQTGRGLVELLQGHLEAGSSVGSAEVTAALGKGLGAAAAAAAAVAKKGKASAGPTAYSVALEIKLTPGEVSNCVGKQDIRRQSCAISEGSCPRSPDG